jgi:hypothetical protein
MSLRSERRAGNKTIAVLKATLHPPGRKFLQIAKNGSPETTQNKTKNTYRLH